MRGREGQRKQAGLGQRSSLGLVGLLAMACADGVEDVGSLSAKVHMGDCVKTVCEPVPTPQPIQPVDEQICEVSGSSELTTEWSVSVFDPVECEVGECYRNHLDVAVGADGSVWLINALTSSDSNAGGVYLAHHGPDGEEISAKTVLFEIADRNVALDFKPQLAVNSNGEVFAAISRTASDHSGTVILRVNPDGSLGERLVSIAGTALFALDRNDQVHLVSQAGVAKLDSSFNLVWSWSAPNFDHREYALSADGSFALRGVRLGRTESLDSDVILGFNSAAEPMFGIEVERLEAALGHEHLLFTSNAELLRTAYLDDGGEEFLPEAFVLERFNSKGQPQIRQRVTFGEKLVLDKYDSAPLEHAGAVYVAAGVYVDDDRSADLNGLLRIAETDSCELLLFADSSLGGRELVLGSKGTGLVVDLYSVTKVVLPMGGE